MSGEACRELNTIHTINWDSAQCLNCSKKQCSTTESRKLLFQSRTNVLEEMSTATCNLQTNFSLKKKKNRQEVIELTSPILLKLDTNVGFGE